MGYNTSLLWAVWQTSSNSGYNKQASTSLTAVVGTYYHVVFTVTGSGAYNMYINGVNIGSGTGCNAPVAGSGYFVFGTYNFSASYDQPGNYVLGRAYSRPLTSVEVATNYASVATLWTQVTCPFVATSNVHTLTLAGAAAGVYTDASVYVDGLNVVAANGVVNLFNYPPAALSGNTVTLSGQLYGNGTYTASASTYYTATNPNDPPYMAFDKVVGNDGNIWSSATTNYTGTNNVYAGSVTTTVGTTSYLGEWLQLQLPSAITLSSYVLSSRTGVAAISPNTWVLAGSTNGTTWVLLDSQTGYIWTLGQTRTFTISSPGAACAYYRIIITQCNSNIISIGELVLQSTPTSTIMPLDLVSVSATVLFSCKRLRTAYTGPVIALSTSSTLTSPQDFYYVNGTLNTNLAGTGTSYTSWVTTNTAYVVTWYDQSGGTGKNASSVSGRSPVYNALLNLVDFTTSGAYMTLTHGTFPTSQVASTFSWKNGTITGSGERGICFTGTQGTNNASLGYGIGSTGYPFVSTWANSYLGPTTITSGGITTITAAGTVTSGSAQTFQGYNYSTYESAWSTSGSITASFTATSSYPDMLGSTRNGSDTPNGVVGTNSLCGPLYWFSCYSSVLSYSDRIIVESQ